MVEVIRDFIPRGRRNRPGRLMRPEWITVHDTANPQAGATALAHAGYLKGAAASIPASWHFTVDDRHIVQHLPVDEVAYHAGDGGNGPGNSTSIGIEICENGDGDREAAEANAVRLIAWLLRRMGLGIERMVPHKKWSGKACPRLLLPHWEEFAARVTRALESELPSPRVGDTPVGRNPSGDDTGGRKVMLDDYLRVVAERDILADRLERIRGIAAQATIKE